MTPDRINIDTATTVDKRAKGLSKDRDLDIQRRKYMADVERCEKRISYDGYYDIQKWTPKREAKRSISEQAISFQDYVLKPFVDFRNKAKAEATPSAIQLVVEEKRRKFYAGAQGALYLPISAQDEVEAMSLAEVYAKCGNHIFHSAFEYRIADPKSEKVVVEHVEGLIREKIGNFRSEN